MKFTYSREADALYIGLDDAAAVASSKRLKPGVNVDLDAGGRLLGIEILRASTLYDRAELESLVTPGEGLTLAEAEQESGIKAETLKKQAQAKRLVATKRGRDWIVQRHDLLNYLENRAPSGRQAVKRKGRRPKPAKVA